MEKLWLKSYSQGVAAEIDLSVIGSIADYLEHAVRDFGPRQVFVSGATGVAITYNELDVLSRQVSAYFQSVIGLPKGARVALMMPNILQYPICLFGLLRAGYVVANVNPLYTPRELEHQLKDSGAEAIIVLEQFAHTVESVIAKTSVKHVVTTGVADMMPFAKRVIGNFLVRNVKKMVPPYSLPGKVEFRTMLSRGAGAMFTKVSISSGDLAFLQYTGGTTGVSKGAMLTHLNVLANVKQGLAWTEPFLDRNELLVTVTAIPLYHIFALGMTINFIGLGGTNVLVADPRNTKAFVAVLAKYPFVSLPAVNTLFNALINDPDFAKIDFSKCRFAVGGGTAVQRPVADRWQTITNSPLCEGYGLTECSPSVTLNPLDLTEFSGSIGLPLPSTEISLRDPEGNEVGLGEPGELCVRGPQVMKGYWNRPQETADVMTPDGYLRTGDIATVDERGFFRIVDRLKDMILVSGFNVFPNEIEEVLMMHPGVFEVAVVGKPDTKTGEAIKVFAVKKNPALTAEDLIAHCRKELTAYKVPRQIEFLDELPKSNVGKILRRELRDRA